MKAIQPSRWPIRDGNGMLRRIITLNVRRMRRAGRKENIGERWRKLMMTISGMMIVVRLGVAIFGFGNDRDILFSFRHRGWFGKTTDRCGDSRLWLLLLLLLLLLFFLICIWYSCRNSKIGHVTFTKTRFRQRSMMIHGCFIIVARG